MNVNYSDINKVYKLNAPRMKYNSAENKFFDEMRKTIPTGYIADKFAKNHAWAVCEAKWNYENLSIDYVTMVNQTATKSYHVTKEEICEMFGWKDFKVINGCSIIPKKLTQAECEARQEEIAKKIAATRRRDNKKLKEMEAEADKTNENLELPEISEDTIEEEAE